VEPDRDPLLGTTLDGRFAIEAALGRGGMGVVYRARHLLIEQRVAVKVLAGAGSAPIDATRRFVREARTAFLLDHPNCVRVTDLGATADGLLYLVMEYLDGRTLGTELSIDGPLAPARALHVAAQVARALDHAHGRGLVHRDLKPDNVMLLVRDGDPDFAKVLDFGLARMFDADVARAAAVSITPLTRQGIVFGTPEYMSPEQALGQGVGPPADLYGLGCLLYCALTGVPPFSGRTEMEILTAHVREPPVAPSARRPDLGLPPMLDGAVARLLAKAPAARPSDARAAAEELDRLRAILAPGSGNALPSVASATLVLSGSMATSPGAADPSAPSAPAPGAAGAGERAHPESGPEPSSRQLGATPPARRHRGTLIAGGIAAVVASTAFGLAVTGGGDAGARRPDVPNHAGADAGASARAPAPTAASDREPVGPTAERGATPPSPSLPPTPGPAAPDAGPSSSTPAARRAATEAEARHARALRRIHAAEAARRAGNNLRQFAEAEEALRLEPQNRRAQELVGEALVKSGDREQGCAFLRAAPRTAAALGCPD
jgi:serine/threonine-protein kinase